MKEQFSSCEIFHPTEMWFSEKIFIGYSDVIDANKAHALISCCAIEQMFRSAWYMRIITSRSNVFMMEKFSVATKSINSTANLSELHDDGHTTSTDCELEIFSDITGFYFINFYFKIKQNTFSNLFDLWIPPNEAILENVCVRKFEHIFNFTKSKNYRWRQLLWWNCFCQNSPYDEASFFRSNLTEENLEIELQKNSLMKYFNNQLWRISWHKKTFKWFVVVLLKQS